jgi:pantetheine-phosphate adenylyltransferase
MLQIGQRTVVVGGTFEQLHSGHRKLILSALQVGDRIIIGLSSDSFALNLKKNHHISSYESRLTKLKTLFSEINASHRVTIVPLNDSYGPAVTDETISRIVVSPETLENAFKINRIRVQKKMVPLEIYVVGFILGDDGKPISTSRISLGLISNNGRLLQETSQHLPWHHHFEVW